MWIGTIDRNTRHTSHTTHHYYTMYAIGRVVSPGIDRDDAALLLVGEVWLERMQQRFCSLVHLREGGKKEIKRNDERIC